MAWSSEPPMKLVSGPSPWMMTRPISTPSLIFLVFMAEKMAPMTSSAIHMFGGSIIPGDDPFRLAGS